ncbi:MAG: aminodeoxychorismate/anthranilate synthase component II [Candidatus Delongbacteria bacterium]|nr:aminodeoxychorismate/anthranilate synthase component II [Candidatus Delongbacteria bacterium]
MNILLIDNYDSFTFNLKDLLERSAAGCDVTVRRNKEKDIFDLCFDILVVSPGPMTWKETGILNELFTSKVIPEKIPVLGVCLGMQFIAGYYGINVDRINNPLHGSRTVIRHNGDSLFKGIKDEFTAARYNSLGFYKTFSDQLDLIAFEKDSSAVMALKHKTLPFAGFQFHPESFLTENGEKMIRNFVDIYV